MIAPLTALLLILSPLALACDPEALHQSYPNPTQSSSQPVSVSFTLDRNSLHAHFEVKSSAINARKELGPREYPYMFDVVEVFLSTEGGLPYYEFELSPFGQSFEVKVLDPKKAFQEGLHMGLATHAVTNSTGWVADFELPLDHLDWKGDPAKIVGNAYAILGKKPDRRFYSRSLPVQSKPNFHQPQFFKPLLNCAAP